MIIPNYELLEKIFAGPQATIYKAFHKKNPQRLLALKVLRGPGLSDYKKLQFRQRIEHLRVLNDPQAVTPIAFESKDGYSFISRDYFDGLSLDKLLEKAPDGLPVKDFFSIACSLARILDKIHEAGIIHGGIKPHNILVNPATLDVRLIDFISAVDVRDASHFIYNPDFVRGTLPYTSPEQTGRINHRVVFSSDLYALGIVFYELLTGRLPFSADDPLELIHSHLAAEAPRVHELKPDIPLALSNIIAKLMLKEPEKRYQSSYGLLADLERCRDAYAASGAIAEFPLESRGRTHRVAFISKMVGRDKEAGIILDEYEQVARGEFRSLFISGLAGIGKTRLIQELQKPMVKHRGYFTSGKFDIYQRNIPYSSLIQALRNLMRTFLTESDDRVASWANRILAAVGNNGKVLTDVIPELEILIGPQPEVKPLPPVESLTRFHDLFDRFLTCLASEENPLTLFIDDLQWCDVASFDFLANIFTNYRNHPCLFFLGAYRHNEVDSSHPLGKLIRNAKESGQPLQEIRLGPLLPEYCHEMVTYILDSAPSETKELSDLISTLAEGNPLFVSQSLAYLHNEDLIYLDENGQWRWDFDKINQSQMPTSVVGLFSSKIQRLPRDLVTLLEFCACMGNTFSPTELSLIREMTLAETYEMLKPALRAGLLLEDKNQIRFLHDRVQEAALSAIPAARRRLIHQRIGNRLLAIIPEGAEDLEKLDNLFTIVSHLNLGKEDNPDPKTAYFLSDLNYHAGNKALDSLATEAANEYFHLSRELLPVDCWEEGHYENTFRIFQRSAKTELMCGNYENSERLLNQLLDHARTDLDRAECLAEQATSLSSFGNFIKAIETANQGLAYFGKSMPTSREEVDRKREEFVAEIAAKDIDIRETVLQMPFTRDRKSRVEHAFYSELLADLYLSGRVPELYLVAAQATLHCLAVGMDEAVIYAFTAMAIYHAEHEEFEQSFVYEDLTYDLAAKYPNTFGATKCLTGAVVTLTHSRSHPAEIVDYCLRAIQCGKNCGDLNNAGYSYGPLMWNLQVQGADLPVIEEYAKEGLQFSQRYHLGIAKGLAEAVQAGWVEPMKKGYAPPAMEEKVRQWERDNHAAPLGSYFIHKALTHYYFGEHEEAGRYLDRARKPMSGLSNSVLKREWHVFLVLNALKLYEKRKESGEGEYDFLAEIRPVIAQIERWTALGPIFKPYLAFIYAELERVTGEFREARSLYLDAINSAQEQGYTFLEGHLNECLGELLLQAGQYSQGVYFTEAARLYRKCRAERKEIKLIETYPEYFEAEKTPYLKFEAEPPASYILPDLDVEYLLKSSLALSAEMELEALLKKIMDVVIESSGAQHGFLLIEEGGDLVVRGESHISEKQAAKAVGQKLEDAPGICKAIVRYAYRTGEKVILGNASREGAFADNREVQELQLRSVLCLPVIKHSVVIGVLFLENRLAKSVFTPEKTQMTELLTSQAAISLENAALLNEHQQAERTLRHRESELRLIMDSTQAFISYVNSQCRYRRVNKVYERWFGCTAADIQGQHMRDVLGESAWKAVQPYVKRALAGEPVTYEQELPLKGIGPVWLHAIYTPDRDDSGFVRGFVIHGMDITQLKKAEEEVKTSLREKEVLLKEVHHRVKNNLQIINSMLYLQMPYIKEEHAIEMFKESRNRIYSMALIHEKLYESESLSKIDLDQYIQSLIINLFRSYGVSERVIRPKISVENLALNVDTVIPCALIINELVSNSLKHAFPDLRKQAAGTGEIRVELRHGPGNKIKLAVGDNGRGLPEGFEVQNCESLGLKLVNVLANQLRGAVHLDTGTGTEFAITFRLRKEK